ncbi:hypothetical protein ACMGDH_07470 [Sphingomonas sp. DT-207]|uniref:hypothetical protein n=1 Tax=Sphingomonas sp. DT-207 TaxID=3396167 RepID=UPI003F1A921C
MFFSMTAFAEGLAFSVPVFPGPSARNVVFVVNLKNSTGSYSTVTSSASSAMQRYDLSSKLNPNLGAGIDLPWMLLPSIQEPIYNNFADREHYTRISSFIDTRSIEKMH